MFERFAKLFKRPPHTVPSSSGDAERLAHIRSVNERYDEQTLQVMQRVLQEDSVAVDVGASNGSILRTMVELAPRGRHFAFEPLPHLATALRTDFPQVAVHELALSDRAGESTFQHVVNAPGYSGLRRRLYDRPDPEINEITVQKARMDDIIPEDVNVAFIKLDVEGGEIDALRGGIATIRRSRPVIVFEAGHRSTGCYNVGPEDIYNLIVDTFDLRLSTMERWLTGQKSFSKQEFCDHYNRGRDYYFISYPGE